MYMHNLIKKIIPNRNLIKKIIPKRNMDDETIKIIYFRLSILILILAIIYSIWISFLIIGVYYIGLGNRWAFLTMDHWIITSVILFVIFIFLELLFVFHYFIAKKKRIESEKPKPLFFKGKRLHIFSTPVGSSGGIYSKTYIKIDKDNILNHRFQMIPPNELLQEETESDSSKRKS